MLKAIKKNLNIVLLTMLILVQLAFLTYCFVYERQGYHSDEIWSYGLANSTNGAHVFKNNEGDLYINCNQWFSGDVFRDYIMVSGDERFAYDSVVENATNDMHPPLSFIILHTICSLFPDTYSEWYAYSINIVAFIAIQIALFMWCRKLFGSDYKALLVCVLYGFSLASLNTMMFIRMYGMATAFTMISVMCHYNIFIDKKCSLVKNFIGIFVSTLLGALTIHLYLVFAFFLSAFFCFYLLFSKQIKKMFAYAGTVLASVGLSIALFPATISHLFSVAGNELRQDKAPLSFDVKLGLSYAADELFGFTINPFPSYFMIHLVEVLLVVLIIVVPAAFVCRKEKWMPGVVSRIKGFFRLIPGFVKGFNWFIIMLVAAMFSYLVIVAESIEIVQTGTYVDRYFMNFYPLLYGAVVYVLCAIIDRVMKLVGKYKTGITPKTSMIAQYASAIVLVLVVLTVVHVKHECYYYFDYKEMSEEMLGQELTDIPEVTLSDIDDGADLIIMLKEYWLMTCLSQQVKDCANFFATCHNWCFVDDAWMEGAVEAFEDIEDNTNDKYWITEVPFHSGQLSETMTLSEHHDANVESRAVSDPDNPLVKERMDKYIECMKELDYVEELTFVGRSYIFGRIVFVYKLN